MTTKNLNSTMNPNKRPGTPHTRIAMANSIRCLHYFRIPTYALLLILGSTFAFAQEEKETGAQLFQIGKFSESLLYVVKVIWTGSLLN